MQPAERTRFRVREGRVEIRRLLAVLIIVLTFAPTLVGQEVTKTQAISRVKGIINRAAATCGIQTRAITATKVKAGWRVTALIWLSASGVRRSEHPTWIVSRANGESPQDQLTFEIANGCQ